MVKRKYFVKDEKMFEKIDEPWKAYFLGWMYADGHMEKTLLRFRINLRNRDKYILTYFSKMIFSNYRPLEKVKSVNVFSKKTKILYRGRPQSKLSVSHKNLSKQLFDLGLVPAKSLILKFPTDDKVPDIYLPYFIRGYFEGDGCISLRKSGQPRVTICCSKYFVSGLCEKISKLGINYSIKLDNNIYDFCIYDYNSICLFYQYIYKDLNIPVLKRKYIKFMKVYNSRYKARSSNKTSKYEGIHYKKKINRWIARGTVNKIRYNIGCYKTEKEAFEARVDFLNKNNLTC